MSMNWLNYRYTAKENRLVINNDLDYEEQAFDTPMNCYSLQELRSLGVPRLHQTNKGRCLRLNGKSYYPVWEGEMIVAFSDLTCDEEAALCAEQAC